MTRDVHTVSEEEAVESAKSAIPASLLRKQKQAIRLAKEYREEHGDPVNNLADVLDQMVKDEALWQAIVEEPYG